VNWIFYSFEILLATPATGVVSSGISLVLGLFVLYRSCYRGGAVP
jgi:hypothetical protein